MDAFRFILENPHPNAATNRQRKRARLVTACDSCRIKKIKCQQSSPNARCEACKSAKIPCLFGDRDRYQAERGVSCAWSPSPPLPQHHQQQQHQQQHEDDDVPASPASSSSSSSRKRKVEDSGLSQDSLHPRLSPSLLPLPSHNHNPNHHHHHPHIPLFDPSRPRFPHPLRMHNLALLFFDSIGPHFPFLDRADILHRIAHSTCSAILANAIAGLAARFSPDPLPASPFYAMATSLAAHVASAPSIEALHALLCITWAEHIPSPPPSPPSNNAWSYSRHAIAMALDLGLGNEATIRVAASPAVRARLRLTWWSVVCLADIAPALATGSQPVLDLNLFDTALPTVADDVSLMRRTTIDAALLRSRIARAHSGTSSEIATLSARLTPALTFSKQALLHWSSLGLGAAFVSMHFALHALCTLAHRHSPSPSSSSSPDPTHPAARTAAKAIVDIFVVVQESGAHAALRDPFLAEALHVALHVFQAESGGSAVARQWSDTFARKCQDGIARVARACAGSVTHHSYPAPPQDTYPALPQDALEYKPASSSSLDLFTVPQNASWLLRPGLVDDSASDTSSSFRSSSHELSPQLNTTLGASPLVRTADAEFSFEGGVFDAASASASEMIDGVDFAGMGMGMGAFFDQSCAGPFAYEGLAADGYAKDANSRAGASAAVFPPVQWLARA